MTYDSKGLNGGKEEVNVVFVNNELPLIERDTYSRLLFLKVQDLIYQVGNLSKLNTYLDEFPLINYYDNFVNLTSLRVKKGIISQEDIISLGKNLVFNGENSNEIKLGLTLLTFTYDENIINELLPLGKNNEYAFYLSKIVLNLKNSDEVFLYLAKSCSGNGKIFYINSIDLLTRENIMYMLMDGWKGDCNAAILWNITVARVGYDYFLYDANLNNETFICFGEILNNLFVYFDYERIPAFIKMVKKYVDVFHKFNKETCSYLALGNVYKYIVEEVKFEDEYYKKAQKLYLKINWMDVFNNALRDKKVDSPLLLQLAIEMEEDLTVKDLETLLKRNPRDVAWYKYIEMLSESDKCNLLIKTVEENFNLDVVLNSNEDRTFEEYQEEDDDISLVMIAIDSLNYESVKENKEFLIKCMEGKNIEIKVKAIEKLWNIKDSWNDDVKYTLKKIIKNEKELWIRNKLIFMLYENEGDFLISDLQFPDNKIDDRDIKLCDIMISSTTYKKFKKKSYLINEGDILTLSCGIDGYKQDKLYVITNFGVVLGEVNQSESTIIKNLINSGEGIVGRVNKLSDTLDFIYISLYKKSDYLMNELKDIINEKLQNIFEE